MTDSNSSELTTVIFMNEKLKYLQYNMLNLLNFVL